MKQQYAIYGTHPNGSFNAYEAPVYGTLFPGAVYEIGGEFYRAYEIGSGALRSWNVTDAVAKSASVAGEMAMLFTMQRDYEATMHDASIYTQ